jgi:hypothetical protein
MFAASLTAQTGSSVTQHVTIEVKPIYKIAVTGDPQPLVIHSAVPGEATASISDNSTAYSILTNVDNMKIAASISDPMPGGTQLLVGLSSSKGTSLGSVNISSANTPVDLVAGILRGVDADQQITYTLVADASVGEVPSQTRVITLTLTN